MMLSRSRRGTRTNIDFRIPTMSIPVDGSELSISQHLRAAKRKLQGATLADGSFEPVVG